VTTGHHRRARALASLGLLAAILAGTAWFVRRHWAEFTSLQIANPHALWPLLATAPLGAIAIGLQLRYLVRPFGVRLAPHEWYGLAIITSFYNILTPFRGGMLAKAAYLHRRHELSLSGCLAMTAGASLGNICVAGIVGLAGLWLTRGHGGPGTAALTIFFAAMTAATLAVMAFTPRFGDFENPVLARIVRIAHGWRVIRDDTAVLALTFLATGLQYLLAAAATFLSFVLIGVPIDAGTSLVLASLTMLSVFVGITPAGLGVVEAVAVVGGIAVGITPAQSLAAAVARRLITTAVILVLGPCFTFTLLRERRAAAGETP
jgi:uncharacterized membrane protein YbhN (UPF0104 family)